MGACQALLTASPARTANYPRAVRTIIVAAVATVLMACSPSANQTTDPPAGPTAWTRLGTADVHSLAFAPADSDHLYFGHHGGILESSDGGRNWKPLAARADAMSMSIGDGTSLYIAGHDVLQVSRDRGRTWEPVQADLPGLDIHGFTRDPADADRMWAYLAQGGVYESTDGGLEWRLVYDGHIPFLAAVRSGAGTELLGIDPATGLVRSTDGGHIWSPVSTPPAAPIVSIAALPDGKVILLGAGDGMYRSDDAGATWRRILSVPLPLAIAATPDGNVVAAVSRQTDFYRSDDGGLTWPGP